MRVGVERVPGTCGRYRVGLVAVGAIPRFAILALVRSERFFLLSFVAVSSKLAVESPCGGTCF